MKLLLQRMRQAGASDSRGALFILFATIFAIGFVLLPAVSQSRLAAVATALPDAPKVATAACSEGPIFAGSFTQGQNASSQAQQDWVSFRQSLMPANYDTITIKGTFDSVGRSLTDATVVPQIAAALQNGTAGSWHVGGVYWNIGNCGASTFENPAVELNATLDSVGVPDAVCQCRNGSESYTVRPNIGNENWGGVNTATCGGPTQDIQVIFSSFNCCAPPPSGMTGWWPGDGNFHDIQGGYDGTPSGGVTFEPGEVNLAMSFDGTNDTVTVQNFPDPNAAYSFDVWVYWKGLVNGSSHDAILVKTQSPSDGTDSYATFIYAPDQSLYNIVGGNAFSTPPGSVPLNQWFHLAQTFDGSTARVYINGQIVTSSGPFSRSPSTGVLAFGTRSGGQHFFHGLLDEIEIFDRELTQSDIQAIYDAGSLGKCRDCAPAPGGMQSWWPANGDAKDAQDSNDGTLQNGATFGPGKVDQAFSLDGTDDFVNVPDAANLNPANAITLDAWVYLDAFKAGGSIIIAKDDVDAGTRDYLFQAVDNQLQFVVFFSGGGAAGVTGGTLALNTWHHVAGTYDGTTLKIYIDGIEVGSAPASGSLNDTSTPFRIGSTNQTGQPRFFDGLIDEVELFDRALSAAEIAGIADAGSAGKCPCVDPPPQMIAWWPFDGNLIDIQGGHTGTGNGGGPSFVPGQVAEAANFDGVDDYVSVPDSTDWNFGTGDFSFDFWARSTDENRMHAISFDPDPNVRNLDFDFNDTYGLWVYWNSGGGVNGVNAIQVGTTGDYTDGQWHHFALTRSGATWTLYIDGAVAGTATYSSALDLSGSSNNSIGKHGFFSTQFFWNGQIDEVEIFKNHALTADEVAAIYNAAGAGKCKPDDSDHDGDPDTLDCNPSDPNIHHGATEQCNGVDDNCDGQVDEGFPDNDNDGAAACVDCNDSDPNVHPGATDVCNRIDDDCDGQLDEDFTPEPTNCGVGACASTGTTTCVAGTPGDTCTPGTPTAETCNGIDDDCDGTVDEGNPGGGFACNTGQPGVCAAGTTQCSGGTIVCNQNTQPSAETCNGIDDDCDGVVDNGNPGGGQACNTGQQGVCAAGTTQCSNGSFVCNQNTQPSPEVCNGLDDDCDGQIDEGLPPRVTVSRLIVQAVTAREGQTATFTVSITSAVSQPVIVNYTMSGSATYGSDYTLSGVFGQIVIPAGRTSGSVTLSALVDHLKEPNETATMTLVPGGCYTLPAKSSLRSATVTIPKNNT